MVSAPALGILDGFRANTNGPFWSVLYCALY